MYIAIVVTVPFDCHVDVYFLALPRELTLRRIGEFGFTESIKLNPNNKTNTRDGDRRESA